tara:strand:- start:2236 stop:3228 length:993 start_codon:yes stop_codon:yes gene_type:complete
MAHQITKTDGLVLNKNRAWHGLGKVVEDAPSPYQALHLADLDWSVVTAPLHATTFLPDGETPLKITVPDRHALVRDDTNEVLGIVSDRYEVLQNRELADLIYEVAEAEDITVESAGSLNGGKRVFFLCHLDTFGFENGDDEVKQYAMFRTGHDGKTEVSVRQTNVRVVCANTEAAAIAKDRGVGFRHRGNILDNVRTMRMALGDLRSQALAYREFAERCMATPAPNTSEYFNSVWMEVNKVRPALNSRADSRRKNMIEAWDSLQRHEWNYNFAGTAWGTYNAVTQWANYNAPVRRTKGATMDEARMVSRIDGRGDAYSKAAAKVMETVLA